MIHKTSDYTFVLNNMCIITVNATECSCDNLKSIAYTKNALNIFMINICSIKKHFDELCITLDSINVCFQVIILTESWLGLQNIPINNFQIDGYSMFTSKLNKNKKTLIGISVNELNTKAQTALKIMFKTANIEFLIYAIYRSPNSNLDITLRKLNNLILNNLITNSANYKIILGDINIDLLSKSRIEDDYLLLMAEYGFVPLIKNITRPKSFTCIDHVFIKTNSLINILPTIPHINITDHYPIVISIKNILNNRNNKPNPLTLTKINNIELSYAIKIQDWTNVYESTDVNIATNTFIEILNTINTTTSKQIKIPSKTKKIKP